MQDTLFRRTLFLILLVSVLMRVGFLAFGDVLPVMWDARRYAAGALAMISFVDAGAPTADATEQGDRQRFRYYYDEYLQGEKIEWLAYTPHTLTQAREELFISGPLYPLVLGAIIYISPAADFSVARVFGILLDVLANLLLVLVGLRLVGRAAALIAGAAYALYFPFILASTMLLLETSTSLLILLALYLMLRATETGGRKALIWAGVVTGALVLNKPTAMLLAGPFVAGLFLYTRRDWKPRLFVGRLLFLLTPVVVIVLAWGAVASSYYGQPTLRDPEYADANLRQSTSIEFEGYGLDKAEADFWTRSIADDIMNNPIGFVGLTIKKFDRLWRRPYNDFKRVLILPYQAGETMHLLLVFAGFIGLLVLMRLDFGRAAWPLLIIAYYTAIHLIFHSVSRYNFQAMPMMLLAAGYLVTIIATAFQNRNRFLTAPLALAVVIIVAGWFFSPDWINSVLHTGLNSMLVVAVLAIRVGLILLGLLLIFRRLNARYRVGRLVIPIVVAIVVGGVAASNALARNEWSEFECRLSSEKMKAGTRLYISDLQPVKEGEMLAIVADVNSGAGRQNTFTIGLSGITAQFVGGRPPLLQLFYPKPTYKFYSTFIPLGIEEFRQYAIVPVTEENVRRMLDEAGYVDIWLAINNRLVEDNNYISVWGQFPSGGDTAWIPGWRFTSIERYVHEDDPRVRYPVKYLSDSTRSYYIRRNETGPSAGEDLSPTSGLQTGRYNIFLMHFRPDGSVLIY